MPIQELCFEQIQGDYFYAQYGKLTVIMMKSCGYINATHLCKMENKQFHHWLENKESQKLMSDFEKRISATRKPDEPQELHILITEGPAMLRGHYLHDLLIPHVASWASPGFASEVSKIMGKKESFIRLRKKNESISVPQLPDDTKSVTEEFPEATPEENIMNDSSFVK